jgi:predicted PurR-regulated permease PerM
MGDVDVAEAARNQIQQLGGFLAGSTVGLVSGLGGVLLQAGVALFTLYYLLADGPELLGGLSRFVPVDDDLTDALVARSREIIFATVYGHVIVAIIQGVLAGLVWWALGLPGPALWGTVMLIFSLLPAVGPPVVWVPTVAVLALQGDVWRAVALAALGAFVIGTIDNLLRPRLVSDRAQLHPLVGFFSVLGGIVLFGLAGLFMGPIVWVVGQTLLEVTRAALDPDNVDAV